MELIQRSPEWYQARLGSLGASRIHEALARTKSGWGASRANLMATMICERLTGLPQDSFQNAAMLHGIETEPDARTAYEFMTGCRVTEVGLVRHPTIEHSHASPDGLVGDDGLLEIKCPSSATHLDSLLGEEIAGKYVTQMQWQMACTGRAWCDFVSFDPRLPEGIRIIIRRVPRSPTMISSLEADVKAFLLELHEKVERLHHIAASPAERVPSSVLMAG